MSVAPFFAWLLLGSGVAWPLAVDAAAAVDVDAVADGVAGSVFLEALPRFGECDGLGDEARAF